MRFAYYDRLSPASKEVYRRSDAIETLELPPGIAAAEPVLAIRDGLTRGHRATVQKGAQMLIDALVAGFAVPAGRRAREGGASLRFRWRAAWALRAGRGYPDRAHLGVDAHGATETGRGVQIVSAHADPRVPASPRLRALQAPGDVPYRGVLQARVEPEQRVVRGRGRGRRGLTAGASCRRKARRCSRPRRQSGKIRPLPEERCNSRRHVLPGPLAMRPRRCQARGFTIRNRAR